MLHSVEVVRRLIISAVIAVCIGASIAETFDSWDQTARDGNDTEANVLIAAMCVGIAFAVGTLVVVKQIRVLAFVSAIRTVVTRTVVRELNQSLTPDPTSSPPAILRV